MIRVSCFILALAAAVASAQVAGPPPDHERGFFLAQAMRAIDEKANLLIDQGKPEAAIVELEKVLTMDVPAWHPAFEMKVRMTGRLASTYAAVGRTTDAVRLVEKLLAAVPKDTPAEAAACLDAGMVYRQARMPEEALKAFDRAIVVSQKLAESGRPSGPPSSWGRPTTQPPTPQKGEVQ
jgi:tetratricopeptide (TPR) repeat protein